MSEDEKLIQKFIDSDPKKAVEVLTTLEPKKAYDLLFDHPDPPAVARAMPFEDAYFIVKSVGESDALDFLEMLDTEKIQSFLDLDCWDKDQLSKEKVYDWLTILMEFEDDRFHQQIQQMDNYLKLALFKPFLAIDKIEEPDENPYLETKDVFITPDNRYAIRFFGTEDEKRVCYEVMMRLYRLDLEYFYWFMEGIYWETAIELEENAYQEKTNRLSARGFPDYYTALEVFAVVDPDRFAPGKKYITPVKEEDVSPAESVYLTHVSNPDSLLRRAMAKMEVGIDQVQTELLNMTNMVSMAHRLSFTDFYEVGQKVQQVEGFLSLALEYLNGNDIDLAAQTLEQRRLLDIYKIGRSVVIRKVRTVRLLLDKVAEDGASAAATMFEPATTEFIDGLLQRDPVIIDAKGKVRFFASLADLLFAEEQIKGINQFARVCHDLLGLTHELRQSLNLLGTNQHSRDIITYNQLFCTAFANDRLGREFTPLALSADDCNELARRTVASGSEYRFTEDVTAHFYEWLEEKTDGANPVTHLLFRELFAQMAEQLGTYAKVKQTDVRYLSSLIVKIDY